jgi:phage-related protein
MPESAKVEILIDAFTEAAQQAVDDVGDELGDLSRSAQPAQSAMDEVGDELDDTTSSAAVAGDAIDETTGDAAELAAAMQTLQGRADEAADELDDAGRSAAVTSGLFSRLTVSTGGLSVAMGSLSTVAVVSLIPSLLTLSTILLPLASVLGVVATAAVGLAGVLGGLTAVGVITHMEELKAAFQDVRGEIMEIIEPLGDVFGPLLVDAVRALPELVQAIVDSLGPLDQFADTLRELGATAMEAIPMLTGFLFDLAEIALPTLIDVMEWLMQNGPGIWNAMTRATERLADPLLDVAGSFADLLPTLHELGIVAATVVLPAIADLADIIDSVAEFVLSLDDGLRRLAVAGAITAPAIFGVASAVAALTGPVGLAVAAVAAFAAAYRANFMGIQDVVNDAVGGVIDRLRDFWNAHQDIFQRIRDTFERYLGVVQTNLEAVRPAFEAIAQNLRGLFSDALALVGDILRGLVPIFEQVVDILRENQDHFRDLANAILGAVNTAITALRGLLAVIRFVFENYTLPLLSDLVDVWETHFGDILDETSETMAAIQGYIQPVLDAVSAFWAEHGDTIMGIVRTVMDVIRTVVVTRLDAILTAVRVVLNVLQGDWDEAFAAIEGFVDRTMGRIVGILESIGLIDPLTSQADAAGGVVDSIMEPFSGLIGFFQSWVGVVSRVFSAHFQRLRELWQTHAGPLFQELRETWVAIRDNVIRPVLSVIETVISVYLTIYRALFSTFVSVITALWNAFGDEILTIVEAAWNAISIVVVTAIDALLTAIRVFLNVLQGDWDEAFAAIEGFVNRSISRIVGFVSDWGPQLVRAFAGILTGIGGLFQDAFTAMIDFLVGALATMLTQIQVWGDTVYNFLLDIWNGVISVMENALEGFINSAIDAINAFLSTLDDVAAKVSEIPGVDGVNVGTLDDVDVDTGLDAERRSINREQKQQQNEQAVRAVLDVQGDNPLARFIEDAVEQKQDRQTRQDTRRTRRQEPQ